MVDPIHADKEVPVKVQLVFFSLLFGAQLARADVFETRIHEIVSPPGAKESFVKWENGRVSFLPNTAKRELTALRAAQEKKAILEVTLDEDNSFMAASTMEDPEEPRSEEIPPEARITYEPTVVGSLTKARTIFSRMKRGWQDSSQCYNRAHVWAYEEFNRSGLKSIKLFLFFTNRYIRNYRYKWWFHVSPMAMVKEGGSINRRVLDRRYTGGPRFVKTWTNIFIHSKRSCPVVHKYSDYSRHQESQDCYLIPVSQYYWQPRDIDRFERYGTEKTSFIRSEVDHAYWEAF